MEPNEFLTHEIDMSTLPRLLRDGASVAGNYAQADMLLLALTTVAGYALPKCYVRHGKPEHRYRPNLMTLVIAPPASGKGVMNLGRRLLGTLQSERRAAAEAEAVMAELTGTVPRELTALIPANSSSNAFLQLLADNDGRGVMLETEMDTLSAIWRRDYGNYSAAFRQAFEHETITKSRKVKGDTYLEVKNPQLSVLLSGTLNQLKPLLESRENGLASRMLCYQIDDVIPFDESSILKHDEPLDADLNELYNSLEEELTAMAHWMESQDHDAEWRLKPEQSQRLRDAFHDAYQIAFIQMEMPLSFDAVVKRMVVTILRIGMTFSMIRWWEDNVWSLRQNNSGNPEIAWPEVIECGEQDFETLMKMLDVLCYHAVSVYYLLPQTDAESTMMVMPGPGDEAQAMLDRLPGQFTTSDAIKAADGVCRSTVMRYLEQLTAAKQILHLAKGKYVKA